MRIVARLYDIVMSGGVNRVAVLVVCFRALGFRREVQIVIRPFSVEKALVTSWKSLPLLSTPFCAAQQRPSTCC